MTILIEKMKARMQRTSFTCGPACLRSILHYYAIDVPESELVSMGDIDKDGTSPSMLRQLAREYGFRFYSKHNATIHDLEKWLLRELPILTLMQAWGANNGHSGHYVLVSGLSSNEIILADPSNFSLGYFTQQKRMSKEEFLSRWFDCDAERTYRHWIAICRPQHQPR